MARTREDRRQKYGQRWPEVVMEHERMAVYHLALEFFEGVNALTSGMPRKWRYLIDQLQRAALSILLNIAEGAGEFAPAEKARFYRIAQRSAIECRAALDAARRVGLVPPQYGNLHEMAGKIYAQLVGLARSIDQRAPRRHSAADVSARPRPRPRPRPSVDTGNPENNRRS